ncbi:MAG: hypothetical protein HY800_05960, partial [Ignavibacteriales bacterium]|nr:hypothetical protein [Ignavibacteriales bacterium]
GQARKRALTVGEPRAVCDYIAGMTDRYVALEYQRVFRKEPLLPARRLP